MKRGGVKDPVALGGEQRAERLMGLMERNLGYVPGFAARTRAGSGCAGTSSRPPPPPS